MRPYLLAESNWSQVKDQKFDLVILPWGATEAHNYHLPYATDNIQVDHIAAESARIAWEAGTRLTVLPSIPFGVNTGQRDIRLNINMSPSTQSAVLHDVLEVLDRQQIYKLLLLNGHGGNNFKSMVREAGLRFPSMTIAVCNWFQVLDKSEYFEMEGDHADEMETSLMLYIAGDLVRPLKVAGSGSEKKPKIAAFREGWAWMERRWTEISSDTGVGDPSRSSAAKGERFFQDLTRKLAGFYSDLASADPDDLYT